MKESILKYLFLVFLCVVLAGCMNRYQITLTNNNVITTRTKPKLNPEGTAYRFIDVQGTEWVLPVFKIKELAPL